MSPTIISVVYLCVRVCVWMHAHRPSKLYTNLWNKKKDHNNNIPNHPHRFVHVLTLWMTLQSPTNWSRLFAVWSILRPFDFSAMVPPLHYPRSQCNLNENWNCRNSKYIHGKLSVRSSSRFQIKTFQLQQVSKHATHSYKYICDMLFNRKCKYSK